MGKESRINRAERHTRRLETEYTSAGTKRRGFITDLSETGLFLRTSKCFDEGTTLDMKIYLPEDKESLIKGIVMRAINTDLAGLVKNGMGIRLTRTDEHYFNFVKALQGEPVMMIKCPHCGAKNKIHCNMVNLGPACGKCGTRLSKCKESQPEERPTTPEPAPAAPAGNSEDDEKVIVKCKSCGAKNKIPRLKLGHGPKCGRCRSPLPTE